MRDILSVSDFEKEDILQLCDLSEGFRRYRNASGSNLMKVNLNFDFRGRLMGTLFIEPSTRTRLSFESAMKRLGGDVIKIDNPKSSSTEKGESFQDTLRTIGQYVDVLVVRTDRKISDHPRNYVNCPVINAGDGAGEHPTQALTDLYTMWRKFPDLKGQVAITGDLKNGRAAHSVIRMLNQYTEFDVHVYSYTPFDLSYIDGILYPQKLHLIENEGVLNSILKDLDVLYMTRFQKERESDSISAYNKFILTKDRLETMKRDAMLLHPLPRLDEIPREIDDDPRAAYFEQVQNGMYARMALLHKIFS
jgi:aspartate carbamoyltransferase catalytic subunit